MKQNKQLFLLIGIVFFAGLTYYSYKQNNILPAIGTSFFVGYLLAQMKKLEARKRGSTSK